MKVIQPQLKCRYILLIYIEIETFLNLSKVIIELT